MDLGSVQKGVVFSGLLRKAVSKTSDRDIQVDIIHPTAAGGTGEDVKAMDEAKKEFEDRVSPVHMINYQWSAMLAVLHDAAQKYAEKIEDWPGLELCCSMAESIYREVVLKMPDGPDKDDDKKMACAICLLSPKRREAFKRKIEAN